VGTDVKTGRSDILFDPNPNLLGRFALGGVEFIHWSDAGGHRWEGRLYYPAHYRAGIRYPLVIQTHGYAGEHEFSIYGQGSPWAVPLGPGWSVYLAQPLASRDVAVLQIGGPDDAMSQTGTEFDGTKSRARTLADAAEHLVDVGLVDKTKVGIMGHSATGRVIEDALAYTDFPYAAAIAADHYELSYSQAMETGWDHIEGMPAPFGKDLSVWLNGSPAFNVDQIRTPLQIEVTSGGDGSWPLLRGWEMFSRLRYLKKPVEYYVLPDIEHGSHYVQNPRQLLALQNRALDWWLFWLKNEEDPDGMKAGQYAQWRALRAMHIADLARPKPPLRMWTSTP
jgi:dipeptidyl aminopeptidase/acylaminoacyl peptidase